MKETNLYGIPLMIDSIIKLQNITTYQNIKMIINNKG